jgi:hypothetical protein
MTKKTVHDWLNAHLEAGDIKGNQLFDYASIMSVNDLLMNLTEWSDLDNPTITLSDGAIKLIEWNKPDGEFVKVTAVIEVTWPGGTTFLQATGYHSSYGDSYWENDLVEVEPYQVVVTCYRPINNP